MSKKVSPRAGCKDVWNAFMVRGTIFSPNDIPLCPTTAKEIPTEIVSFVEARALYNRNKKRGNSEFRNNAFVHFYIDDYKFDGNRNGIWFAPRQAAEILRHFAGIITPDFSTYADFPEPIKIYNTYRMRAFGYWYGRNSGAVINNVRWGTEETFRYCFDGIERNSVVAIGTVASGLRNRQSRKIFERGFSKMLEVLSPRVIVVYGSDNYPCFDNIRERIQIVKFSSRKSLVFKEHAS